MKRLLLILLVLCLSATASFSTGVSNGDSAEAEKPVELTWYYFLREAEPDQDLVEAYLSELTLAKIGATVQLKPVLGGGGDYKQKLNLVLASGEEFDLAFSSPWGLDYVSTARQGAFVALDDIISNFPTLLAAKPEWLLEGARVDGSLYGIPHVTPEVGPVGSVLLKEYVDSTGIGPEDLDEWADLEGFLSAVREQNPEEIGLITTKTGFWGDYSTSVGFDKYGMQGGHFGLRVDDSSLRPLNLLETPEFESYVRMVHSWYESGYINEDAPILSAAPSGLTSAVGPNRNLFPDRELGIGNFIGRPVVFAPFGEGIVGTSTSHGLLTTVSATSNNPEKALALIELANTDLEVITTLMYGIEGTHWDWHESGKIHVDVVPDSGYFQVAIFSFGDFNLRPPTFSADISPEQRARDKAVRLEMMKDTISSPVMGFIFDSTPINSQLVNFIAVCDEKLPGLVTGVADPDVALPELIDLLKAAGSDEIIAEIKRQQDAWLAVR